MNALYVLLLAVLVNIPIALYAILKKSLRIPDGLLAAAIMGILLFMANWFYWAAVIIFFASSSLLTRYKEKNRIKQEAMEYAEKGGTRDAFQVFANGGIAMLAAIYVIINQGIWKGSLTDPIAIGAITSVATVTADTWATEIGVLSRKQPVWILNPFKKVPRGTSGGISLRGIGATALGSSLIAFSYFFAATLETKNYQKILIITIIILIGGIFGSLVDSFLGAIIQAQYECPVCKKITEKKVHLKCGGTITKHVKGLKIINNDIVNVIAALIPSIIVYFFTKYVYYPY